VADKRECTYILMMMPTSVSSTLSYNRSYRSTTLDGIIDLYQACPRLPNSIRFSLR
jgi:uncharacterized alpha-E superfamily protein